MKNAPGITCRSIVIGLGLVPVLRREPRDGIAQGNRLMMKETVNNQAKQTHAWIEDDEPAAGRKRAPELFERRSRITKVMPDIEKDQIRNCTIGEGKPVSILRPIQPGIGKHITGYAIGNNCFDLPQAGANLDRCQVHVVTALPHNVAVEPLVNPA